MCLLRFISKNLEYQIFLPYVPVITKVMTTTALQLHSTILRSTFLKLI